MKKTDPSPGFGGGSVLVISADIGMVAAIDQISNQVVLQMWSSNVATNGSTNGYRNKKCDPTSTIWSVPIEAEAEWF